MNDLTTVSSASRTGEVSPVSSTAVTAAFCSLVNTRDVTAKSDAYADNLPMVARAGSGAMRNAEARPMVASPNRSAPPPADSSVCLNGGVLHASNKGPEVEQDSAGTGVVSTMYN